MEKRKSILDSDQMKKKLLKLSPHKREIVKQRIIETERNARKYEREEEAIMRLPKEQRLKEIYGKSLKWAFDLGITIGKGLMRKKDKEASKYYQEKFRKQFKPGLTLELKKAGVLPLGR